jgi:hypothetical protein
MNLAVELGKWTKNMGHFSNFLVITQSKQSPIGRKFAQPGHPGSDLVPIDRLTCVPDVLDPDVGAGGEEEPVNRDEEKANHVGGESNADKED